MKRTTKKRILTLLLVVFCGSTFLLLRQAADNAGADSTYEDALAIASGSPGAIRQAETQQPEETQPEEPAAPVWIPAPVEDDPYMEELAAISLEALREINPDVIGWIRIPDTRIDYPLMQGTDNDYYLNHTWDNHKNAVGSIFLEYRNSPELTDYNTIVYGHNMNNGSMFAGLRQYSSAKFCQKHPYVYLLTDAGVYRYEVFSSYKAKVDSVAYGLSFQQEQTRADFLIHALENSDEDLGIVPEKNDRILTLSTCSGAGYSTRWVVHARLPMVEAA